MAVSLKHSFIPPLADSGVAGEVSTNAWLDEHLLTAATGAFLVGTGAGVEEQTAATARATMGAEVSGAAAAAVAAHLVVGDPHPQYLTPAEASGAYAPTSHTHSLDDLTGVTLTSPSNGQVLKYNGTDWVNAADATGGGGGGLTDGDFGDIVVSGTGTVMTVDPAVLSAFGRTLLDDTSAEAMRATLGMGNVSLAPMVYMPSRAYTIASYHPPAAPDGILTAGYTTAGDGGGDIFRKALSEPAHTGKLSITLSGGATVWYEREVGAANVKSWGAKGDGSTNDAPSCQAAVDYVVFMSGGDVVFIDGTYLLTGQTSADTYTNGIVVPLISFTVDNRIRLVPRGRVILRANSDNMVLVRVCQPGTEVDGFDIDGNGHTNVWGVGLVPQDRAQTITLVSQSFCKVRDNHIHDCVEGIVIEPGPTVAAAQSGAFYAVITGNHLNLNTRSIWLKPCLTDSTNRPTRTNISFNRIERGNCGVDVEYATETTMLGNYYQFFKNTYSATPYNPACAIHIGALTENTWVYGGAPEQCDAVIFNEGVLPNAISVTDFPLTGVTNGMNFSPVRQLHTNRLTRRTASYEQLTYVAHHSGFARIIFDYDAANVKDVNIETNSVRRMSWFNGTTTHYGSLGNVVFNSNGAQITFTRVGANTIAAPDGGTLNFVNAVKTQNAQSATYTLVLADSGKSLLHPSADTTARTWTIPANATVAFPIGCEVEFINQNAGGVITIAITTDTMRLSPGGTTGSRTLAANGIAVAKKITATEWIISGTGLT